MKEPWYAGGLRFRCTGCGDCCTGEPGAVWVNDEEIARLQDHVGLAPAPFAERHLRWIGDRRSLVEATDGACTFFDRARRRCTVYEARPVQCRTWPFWPQNIESEAAWAEAEADCPGAGEGERVGRESIEARLVELRLARGVDAHREEGDGRQPDRG